MTMEPKCLDCGKSYSAFGMDTHLLRSQWLEIHPDENGLLCAQCIVNRIQAKVKGATVIHLIAEVSPCTNETANQQSATTSALQSALDHIAGLICEYAETHTEQGEGK